MTKEPVIKAALDMPQNDDAYITQARIYQKACSTATGITFPDEQISKTGEHIDTLANCQEDVKARVPGAVPARKKAKGIVNKDLQILMGCAQAAANKDPVNAMALLNQCKFKIINYGSSNKYTNKVVNGELSGSVKVFDEVTKGAKTNEWNISEDGELFTTLPSTTASSTEVFGLTPGKKYYFRHRAVTKNGYTNWSQIVSIIVI